MTFSFQQSFLLGHAAGIFSFRIPPVFNVRQYGVIRACGRVALSSSAAWALIQAKMPVVMGHAIVALCFPARVARSSLMVVNFPLGTSHQFIDFFWLRDHQGPFPPFGRHPLRNDLHPRQILTVLKFFLPCFSWPLSLTEAGTQRRASLHLITGENLPRLDPGGLEIFETNLQNFARVLTSANHTLKRALTDPRLFSGIGNAYSDEILFDAGLSPITLTQKLNAEQIERLFETVRSTLTKWMALLRAGAGDAFPEKVTAFRPEMAVHGRYQQPCPRCGAKIQRIRYASNETNYCPNCQTGGKLLADRALSRLLRADWPRSVEELEGLTPFARKE